MAARVTHPPEILRVTSISPQMTEEEFLNQLHRNYGLVLKYSWKQLPDSGAEALVELDNPERAIALNQQILSQNPSELKLEKVRDTRVLTNLLHDILVGENTKKSEKQKGTVLKVSIMDVKLRVTISSLRRHFQRYGQVLMIAVVGPKPLDEKFCTLRALVQFSDTHEAHRACHGLNEKEIFPQSGGKMIIELTEMNEIFVTDRVNQTNPVRHGGQYRNDLGSRPALQPAGPGRGRFPGRTYNDLGNPFPIPGRGRFPQRTYNDLDNPVPRHHGRPPRNDMPPPFSTPVLHLCSIPVNATERQMFNIFTLYGNVLKIMFMDPGRNQKRTSLIELESCQQANIAHLNLDGFIMYGSRIQVELARRTSIDTRTRRDAFIPLPEECRRQEEWLNFPPTSRLRVTGLRPGVTIEELRIFFQRFNPIDIRLNSNNNTDDCEVDFHDAATATEALATLHGPETQITFLRE